MGTTGMALGSAGVEALANLRGRSDMFGRLLEVSEHAVADSIAGAAELLMGEADVRTQNLNRQRHLRPRYGKGSNHR